MSIQQTSVAPGVLNEKVSQRASYTKTYATWTGPALTQEDLIGIAWVYYYFSVQFRESLETARKLYPGDQTITGNSTEANATPTTFLLGRASPA